jgi:hypothetical protein
MLCTPAKRKLDPQPNEWLKMGGNYGEKTKSYCKTQYCMVNCDPDYVFNNYISIFLVERKKSASFVVLVTCYL